MKPRPKLAVFTDKFPLLGPLVWILTGQYFVAQFVVAAAWSTSYSLSRNAISDLGNTVCANYSGRFVCSPKHQLMNASFTMLGVTMALGALLINQEFRRSRASLVGFSLMALAGLGTIIVGLFPENTTIQLHALGAFLAFGPGNVSLLVLALALRRVRPSFRLYTLASGIVSLAAFGLFISGNYLGLGEGGMERLVSYPQTVWLVLFGLYMSASHVRRKLAN